MPISLRMTSEKENKIKRAAGKAGKTKTGFILEAVDEKLGLLKNRERIIRESAAWLSHEEAEELRKVVRTFSKIHRGDWK